jgi:ribonuclease BN (tRNA processing enzyme)
VKIRVLGCSGAIAKHCRTTSFLLGAKVLIDAGTGVGDLTLDEMQEIDHVFLTHSHLDHIAALPLMLDAVGARRNKPISLYGLQSTLDALKTHIFNDVIWPDFLKIPSAESPFLRLFPIEIGQQTLVDGLLVEALPAQHSVPALGYAVSKKGPCWVFTGDTGNCTDLWSRVNQLNVGMLVIETAFSNKEMELAVLSGHFAPDSMVAQLDHLRSDRNFPIFITHTKPAETELIMREIEQLNDSSSARRCYEIHWLNAGQEFSL